MIEYLLIFFFKEKPLRSIETSKNVNSSTTVWLLEMSGEKKIENMMKLIEIQWKFWDNIKTPQ